LYRAKALVDLCVVTALAAVVIAPFHAATPYVDLLGSIFVASYLLWNGLRMAQSHLDGTRSILTGCANSYRKITYQFERNKIKDE